MVFWILELGEGGGGDAEDEGAGVEWTITGPEAEWGTCLQVLSSLQKASLARAAREGSLPKTSDKETRE